MIFTRRFFILFALGFLPLFLFWQTFYLHPLLKWAVPAWDLCLLLAAFIDYRLMEKPPAIEGRRFLPRRFMIGEENDVRVFLTFRTSRRIKPVIKDEYPPELELRGERLLKPETIRKTNREHGFACGYRLYASSRGGYRFGDLIVRWPSRLGLALRQIRIPAGELVKVYPNIRRARAFELSARRNRQLQLGARRSRLRGQGRDFESLRDYVRGDEMRHISWTATARRGRLITRQYQIEKNQSIVVMIDAGRLMTSRIETLTKLDHAINAALAIGYVAVSGGDNIGLLVFNRQVASYLPPKRGHAQLLAMTEALCDIRPQMIEPSYARAFHFLSRNCKRRSLVVILTDLIDRDASSELLAFTATLLPRHLPLIVTIGDNDLRELVSRIPEKIDDVYRQSVAEELLRQREEALGRITELGGLALDVPAGQLSFQLVNKYLEVKERGLL